MQLVILGLAQVGGRPEEPPGPVVVEGRRVVQRLVGEHAERLPVIRELAGAVQRRGGRRARLRQEIDVAVVHEDERIGEMVRRREHDPLVVQVPVLVELGDADVPAAAAPRDLLEEQP